MAHIDNRRIQKVLLVKLNLCDVSDSKNPLLQTDEYSIKENA
jgi:hypothetical protein